MFVIHSLLFVPENEVDGKAFLLLKDDQIESMVAAIGAQTKLIKKEGPFECLEDSGEP